MTLVNLVFQAHGYKELVMIGDGATVYKIVYILWQLSIRNLLNLYTFTDSIFFH
jgi:hypothetical protein